MKKLFIIAVFAFALLFAGSGSAWADWSYCFEHYSASNCQWFGQLLSGDSESMIVPPDVYFYCYATYNPNPGLALSLWYAVWSLPGGYYMLRQDAAMDAWYWSIGDYTSIPGWVLWYFLNTCYLPPDAQCIANWAWTKIAIGISVEEAIRWAIDMYEGGWCSGIACNDSSKPLSPELLNIIPQAVSLAI